MSMSGPVDNLWLFDLLRRVLLATGAVVMVCKNRVLVSWPCGFKRGQVLVEAKPADNGQAFTISIRIDMHDPIHILDLEEPSLRLVDRKDCPKWMGVVGADPVTLPWDMELLEVNTIMKIAWMVQYATSERLPNLNEACEDAGRRWQSGRGFCVGEAK